MKCNYFFIVFLVFFALACKKDDKETYPSPPENYNVLASPVNFEFIVSNMNLGSVELGLKNGNNPYDLHCLFELSDDWVKGDFGLVLSEMSANNILPVGVGDEEPDISRFEMDNSGKEVKYYPFEQTLVEDDKEKKYIKMSYIGPSMPLIKSLKIKRNIQLPQAVSAQFVDANILEFQAGNYSLDPEINGFWIIVKVL